MGDLRFAECISIPSTIPCHTDQSCASYCDVRRHNRNKTSVQCGLALKPIEYRSAMIVYMNSTRRRHISTVSYQMCQKPRHFAESVYIRQPEVEKSYSSVLHHDNNEQYKWFKSSILVPSVLETSISMHNVPQNGTQNGTHHLPNEPPNSLNSRSHIMHQNGPEDKCKDTHQYSDINDNLVSYLNDNLHITTSHDSDQTVNTTISDTLTHKTETSSVEVSLIPSKKDACIKLCVNSYGTPDSKVPTMYILKDGTTRWKSESVTEDTSYLSDETSDLESCDLESHISSHIFVTSRSTVTSQSCKNESINDDYRCRSGPFLFGAAPSPDDTGYLSMTTHSDDDYDDEEEDDGLERRFDDHQYEYMSDGVTYAAEMDDSVESIL